MIFPLTGKYFNLISLPTFTPFLLTCLRGKQQNWVCFTLPLIYLYELPFITYLPVLVEFSFQDWYHSQNINELVVELVFWFVEDPIVCTNIPSSYLNVISCVVALCHAWHDCRNKQNNANLADCNKEKQEDWLWGYNWLTFVEYTLNFWQIYFYEMLQI